MIIITKGKAKRKEHMTWEIGEVPKANRIQEKKKKKNWVALA